MSEMAQFVYELYMTKIDQLKDKLPTEEELRVMRRELPNEDTDEFAEEAAANATELNDEPPQKKAAKEKTKKTPEAFKPTPILNEINVDEQEMERQQDQQAPDAETPAQKETGETTKIEES